MSPPLPPDPYQILGVSRDAQIPQIRSAHRKLVLKCHPDKVQDPTLKAQKQDEFQKVQRAYELLSDDAQRQKYDDKVRLDELRRHFQNKANISTPRSPLRHPGPDEVREAEFRPSPFNAHTPPPSATHARPRYSDDDIRGGRVYESAPRPSRRETANAERPPKRDADRERDYKHERMKERERERAEKEKEKERRRRQEDLLRRAEKETKRADKRARERQRDKDIKRETNEKKRHAKPYIEPFFEDEHPFVSSERKKSTSSPGKHHDERRDRVSSREDVPINGSVHPPAPQRAYTDTEHLRYAATYIQASKVKKGPTGLRRSATSNNVQAVQPPVPTPPPVPAAFQTAADEDARRSSAKARRGSGEDLKSPRERLDRGSSREAMDDVSAANVSPPRTNLSRSKTTPVEVSDYPRSPAGPARAYTSHFVDLADHPRGRDRSRLHAQTATADSESEDVYDRRQARKHRLSRRHHSPESRRTENFPRYDVDGHRTRVRQYDSEMVDPHVRHVEHPSDRRPILVHGDPYDPIRYPKVKHSPYYNYEDVHYSHYYPGPSREESFGYA